jgi:hypothetical protein
MKNQADASGRTGLRIRDTSTMAANHPWQCTMYDHDGAKIVLILSQSLSQTSPVLRTPRQSRTFITGFAFAGGKFRVDLGVY